MANLRTIIVALGSAGDVHPNVGLALALRRCGADVLFVGPQVFRPLAERAGIDFVGIGTEDEYYAALRDPDLWHPIRSFRCVAQRLILPALRPVYEIIEKNFQPGGTVVAASGLAFGARIAQDRLGVPLATIHLQPLLLRSAIRPGCFGFPDLLGHLPPPLRRLYFRVADRWLLDPWLAGPINSFRADLGLAPVTRIFDRWVHSPHLVLGLFPEWFAPPQSDWPPNVRLAGFPLWDEPERRDSSEELSEFLAAGDPPVVFTAGSAMLQAKRFFEVAAEICDAMDLRGLLLTEFPEQLPRLSARIRQFDYVPFSAVLPQAAAIVHHGGIGTTAQALAAGIPQLIVPHAHDQPDNAVRAKRLGVADYLLPRHFTRRRAVPILRALLSATVKDSCRRTAGLVAKDSLATASAAIEGLVSAAASARSAASD